MAQSLLNRLQQNLQATTNDPTTPLDLRLFEEAELVLAETLPVEEKTLLVNSLSSLLPSLQQDPTPAVNLLLRLLHDYSYGDILKLGNIPFTDGLAFGDHMVSFNRLIIAIMRKAASNAADAASIAGMLDTMLAFIRLWLCTNDTGVAGQCSNLLLDLLKIDQVIQTDPDAHLPAGGQGLVWKRLFGDRDVYRTFFEACSLTGPSSLKLTKSQRTLAQARLLEWLPKVASMDWSAVSRSHHAEVETEYKVKGGLLDFATSHMVDTSSDVLMYRCLIDFFSDLLDSTKPITSLSGSSTDSHGLRYLVTAGVHANTAAIYLELSGTNLDQLDNIFLYGPAANYIATYASRYPEHFLASQMSRQVITRLGTTLDQSPGEWAHQASPKYDLHLLASLPRRALLDTNGGADWRSSPLSLLPSKVTNTDALNTLATIFHGPNRDIIFTPSTSTTLAQPDPSTQEEAAQARTLYYHYLANNPTFWKDITTHADTIALKDLALSALTLLTAIITSNWSDQPSPTPLPSTLATPPTGHLALLTPPALEYALPYLLKPAQSFANLVGGRGDAESAAYKIAAAKFDALRALHGRLMLQVDQTPGEGYEDILATIGKRLAEGPLSREGEVGGWLGTLEL